MYVLMYTLNRGNNFISNDNDVKYKNICQQFGIRVGDGAVGFVNKIKNSDET